MKIFKKFGKRFISGIICTAIAVSTFSFGSSAAPLNKRVALFTARSGLELTSQGYLSEVYTANQPSKNFDIYYEYSY